MKRNELIDNLQQQLVELGVSKDVLEHPAFSACLDDLKNLIFCTNSENFNVTRENNKLNITYSAGDNTSTMRSIYVSSDVNGLSYGSNELYHKLPDEREAYDCSAVLEHGELIISGRGATLVWNNKLDPCAYFGTVHYFESQYDSDGIMTKKEDVINNVVGKEHNTTSENKYVTVNFGNMRDIRQFNYKDVDSRTVLVRKSFDIAEAHYFDCENNTEDVITYQMIPDRSFRDICAPNYHQENGQFEDLTVDEIEAKISKDDPKIQEGLRKWAVGRNEFIDQYLDNKKGIAK